MHDRLRCRSTRDVSVAGGRTERVRCERSVVGKTPHPGLHRCEVGPPLKHPDGSVTAQVASWT